jgi:POT family proton-dependent oligopeptide transporter
VFADKHTQTKLLGFNFPASYYQSVNSLYIITFLAPAFAWMWLKLGRARKEPSSVMKFSIGMALAAVSFAVMLPAMAAIGNGQKVSGGFLIVLYFFSTCSELCISPVGLSSMSKLAPTRLAGMVMGTWFLAAANGNYLAGRAAGFAEQRGFEFLFYFLIAASLIVALGLFVVSPVIKRMLGKDEPAPLPGARIVSPVE